VTFAFEAFHVVFTRFFVSNDIRSVADEPRLTLFVSISVGLVAADTSGTAGSTPVARASAITMLIILLLIDLFIFILLFTCL
jgi:hypothetical protein